MGVCTLASLGLPQAEAGLPLVDLLVVGVLALDLSLLPWRGLLVSRVLLAGVPLLNHLDVMSLLDGLLFEQSVLPKEAALEVDEDGEEVDEEETQDGPVEVDKLPEAGPHQGHSQAKSQYGQRVDHLLPVDPPGG